MKKKKNGVVLVNIGSPTAPTPQSISRYLWQFLRDKRVVDLAPWKWYPLLKCIILPHRAKRLAHTYQQFWTAQGSLLTAISQQQRKFLQDYLDEQDTGCHVELAMTYGELSLSQALEKLAQKNVEQLIIFPLFPQYSSTTTLAVFDAFTQAWRQRRDLPPFTFIHSYAENENYIQALIETIQRHRKDEFLLFSYHGIPLRYEKDGDDYRQYCQRTTQKVVEKLGLTSEQWAMTFQSRFGREEWLSPYTDNFIKNAPKRGIKRLAVICPGFSADCLETVEEIDRENREYFLLNGGEYFQYIPALNTSPKHIEALGKIIAQKCQ